LCDYVELNVAILSGIILSTATLNANRQNCIWFSVIMLSYYVGSGYTECRHVDGHQILCWVALYLVPLCWVSWHLQFPDYHRLFKNKPNRIQVCTKCCTTSRDVRLVAKHRVFFNSIRLKQLPVYAVRWQHGSKVCFFSFYWVKNKSQNGTRS